MSKRTLRGQHSDHAVSLDGFGRQAKVPAESAFEGTEEGLGIQRKYHSLTQQYWT